MTAIKRLWKQIKKVLTPTRILLIGLLLAGIIWQVLKPEKPLERHVVDTGVVERIVIASGKVELSDQVSFGFQQSGVVSRVLVKSGSRVSEGQLIAQLDLGTLSADLRDARAALTEARYKKQKSQLDAKQKTGLLEADTRNSVQNLETLRTKLMSSDLELFPYGDDATSSSAPTITGTYNGTRESESYKISLYPSSGESGLSARVTGESISLTIALPLGHAVAIGSTGLYIKLPSDIDGLDNTEWKLELPNTRSATYVSNLYQYLDAKKSYENSLADQSNAINLITKDYDGYTEYDIAIERAQAALERVEQSIRLRGLYAPISGTIGRIDIKKGQTMAQGSDVVTILGYGQLQTKLKVPESSIGGVQANDPVLISLDIDPAIQYKGVISSINQAETYVDGSPVYETTVVIKDAKQLKPGMSVRGKITTDRLSNVLRLPELAIITNKDGTHSVQKFISPESNEFVVIPITILLRGTDGLIAVAGELSNNDTVNLRTSK